ncbi:MAG: four helix bundle protein [bacterium]|nr:four helix bundle protein [bacterium]
MNDFQEKLKGKMDDYTHLVYAITKNFPREELFGVTSQFRRATLSVVLNYIEGYARRKPLVRLNFLEIAFGSFKESRYLLHFAFVEKYISAKDYERGAVIADEIGAMLWAEIRGLDQRIER